jgi:uncharacterized protein (TIGR03790 family)
MRAAVFLLLAFSFPAWGLEPKEILVVANKDMVDSREVAAYYLDKRGVPKENLLELSLPKGENIDRADYDKKLAEPIRAALKANKGIQCILTVYGVPLRVGPRVQSDDEKKAVAKLGEEIKAAEKTLADEKAATPPDAKKVTEAQNLVNTLRQRQQRLNGGETQACVDSELMLVQWGDYELYRWQPNPLYWQVKVEERAKAKPTLMTCRLDGPTAEVARRLVDDAMEVEKTGLQGKVYFDARGIKLNVNAKGETGTGYGGYDESFREAAELLKTGKLDVTLDDKPELFASQSCKDTALYAGWYSHANYIDCCQFVKGAVAWHLASSEAVTLRNKDSKVWCPNLLKAGVAATLGPVAEPYTIGFPKPAEFFGFLVTGQYCLAEVYSRTILFSSWMTVLIGDPLYNPYAKKPALKPADVLSSPKGITIFK